MSLSGTLALIEDNIELIRAVQDGSVDDSTFREGRRVEDIAMALFSNVGEALREQAAAQLSPNVVGALEDRSIVAMLFERLYHEESRVDLDLWAVAQVERPDFVWDCTYGDDRTCALWLCLCGHRCYFHVLNVMRTFSMGVITTDATMQARFAAVEQWFERRNASLRARAHIFREAIAGYSGWSGAESFDREREWWFLQVEPPQPS